MTGLGLACFGSGTLQMPSHWVRIDFLGIFCSVDLRSRIKGNQELFSLVSARHEYRIITANERGYLTYRQGAGNGRRKTRLADWLFVRHRPKGRGGGKGGGIMGLLGLVAACMEGDVCHGRNL